jgi:hypothetical protein
VVRHGGVLGEGRGDDELLPQRHRGTEDAQRTERFEWACGDRGWELVIQVRGGIVAKRVRARRGSWRRARPLAEEEAFLGSS